MELSHTTCRSTGLQTHGVVKGDVLALCSPNGIEFVITYFAAASAGAVITTMNPATTGHDMAAQLTSAGTRFLVTTPDLFEEKGRQAAAEAGIRESFVFGEAQGATPFASLVEAAQVGSPVDITSDDLVLLPFSSGTSGLPKGVGLPYTPTSSCSRGQTSSFQFVARNILWRVGPVYNGEYDRDGAMEQWQNQGGEEL